MGNMLPIDASSDGGLGGTSEGRFGPDAVLLCGFLREEAARVREALDELGADFVRVTLLEQRMLAGTLGQALEVQQQSAAVSPALGTPRVLFLSGMSGQEAVAVMDAVVELGV